MRVNGHRISLTPTETRIVTLLAARIGVVVSPEEMIRRVWGSEYLPERRNGWLNKSGVAHLLRVNMCRLRQKLGPARHLIKTHAGLGYLLHNETGGAA